MQAWGVLFSDINISVGLQDMYQTSWTDVSENIVHARIQRRGQGVRAAPEISQKYRVSYQY